MSRTIAAIATPLGVGGIGIVRIAGDDARAVAARVFVPAGRGDLAFSPGYTALYGHVHDAGGTRIDEAVALIFAAPRSYTGEDVVELQCHGGLIPVRRTLAAVLEAGAAPALPGEFTRRAFLNGKIGLTQAEAVMDLIAAQGAEAARAALFARDGALSRRIGGATESLVRLAGHLAAYIDYPEEDIPALEPHAMAASLKQVRGELARLLDAFDAGRILREGARTVIVGRPNVGKSTLMNILAGSDRSIVSEIPGTTRDVVEESVSVGGLVLRLADTAGLRETGDPIESIGVRRALDRLETADLVLAIFDASRPLTDDDRRLLDRLDGRRAVAVINKFDLPVKIDDLYIKHRIRHTVVCSAINTRGLTALQEAIGEVLGTASLDPAAGMLATERQRDCARRAAETLRETEEALASGMSFDALSVLLDDAIAALLELTGERATDRVVDEVFAQFCVGK